MNLPLGSIVVPFLGLPCRILKINHKKELQWSLWVRLRTFGSCGSFGLRVSGSLGELLIWSTKLDFHKALVQEKGGQGTLFNSNSKS